MCQGITKLPRVVWVVLLVCSRLHRGSQHDGSATEEGCDVPSQDCSGVERAISFWSHQLASSKQKYSVTEEEADAGASSTYWLRENGAVERFNRIFKSWISGLLPEAKWPWPCDNTWPTTMPHPTATLGCHPSRCCMDYWCGLSCRFFQLQALWSGD